MSIAVGIDAGYDSHVVARMAIPTEPTSEPQIEIQKNESNGSEFMCQMEYTDALLKFCDKVPSIDEENFESIAKFTAEYFRDSVNAEGEKNFSGVSLVKRDGTVYMVFKSKESEKEMSIPAALGILFLYEFFCVANSGGSSDLLFTTMTQNEWKSYLQSMKSMVSLPSFFSDADVARVRACFTAFGLPDSSFVCRSLPLAISGCYSLWKDAYTKDKMIKRNYAVLDFGATGTSIYLVNFKRHHMKVKCHLHSNEACLRDMELGLANAIISSNPDNEQMFEIPANRYHALELAKKNLAQFNNAKTEFVRIVDSEGFVMNGEKVAFDEKVQRKAFMKACAKTVDAYTSIIALFMKVLTQSNIIVDRIIPFGSIVNLDEMKTMLSKQFRGHASDKRLSNPANRPEAVAEGTLLLHHLIATNQAAIAPEFVKRVFWPSAELEQQNAQGNQMPGILKIFYTHTNLSEEVADETVVNAMTEELTQFVSNQVVEESRRYNMPSDRATLLVDYERVMKNLMSTKQALQKKEEAEKAKAAEQPKPKPKPEPEPEAKSEGETKEQPKAEEQPEEKAKEPEEKTEEPEEQPEKTEEKTEEPKEQPEEKAEDQPETQTETVKSDAMMALEKEEEKLASIEQLIQSDKYLCTTPDVVNDILQKLNECDNNIHLLATGLEGVVLEERPVEEVPEAPKQKKKRRGCCKGKSDVVEMGA